MTCPRCFNNVEFIQEDNEDYCPACCWTLTPEQSDKLHSLFPPKKLDKICIDYKGEDTEGETADETTQEYFTILDYLFDSNCISGYIYECLNNPNEYIKNEREKIEIRKMWEVEDNILNPIKERSQFPLYLR